MRALTPWRGAALAGLAIWAGVAGPPARARGAVAPPDAARAAGRCAADEAIATPKDYAGWDRSAPATWEAVEQYGGIVPEIEEDRSHAPPAWWRYPSARRSAAILDGEAKDPNGLYSAVRAADAKSGDILIRARGAGAGDCGKMAILGARLGHDEGDRWMTLEAGDDGAPAMRTQNPLYFRDDGALRDDVAIFRIRVKKDETLGHVRELRRDLTHLERTVAERPPLIAKNGRGVVDDKVHDLIDEAWSLVADRAFDLDRRELTGRALALGAALDWPGAAVSAAAVLDDVLRRAPARADAAVARAALLLMDGDPQKAVALVEPAAATAGAPARAQYVLGRSLIAAGQTAAGLSAVGRYLDLDPLDPRARRLIASGGADPRLAPPPARPAPGALRLGGGGDKGGAESAAYGFRVGWPLTWRVVGLAEQEAAVLINLATGRVNLDSGDTERAAAVILVQRPDSAAERGKMAKGGARNMFPDARLKPLAPLLPGSRREQFRDKRDGDGTHWGEVTTIQHGGAVYFLVLDASAEAYGKLKDEYAGVVKSLAFGPAPAAPSPATPATPPK